MPPKNARAILSVAGTLASTALLVLIAWRVETLIDQMENRQQGSGQIVRSGRVETERYIGEPLADWRARHFAAMESFGDADEDEADD